jgi:uncharacterized protein (TIGR02271 family)
MANKSSVHVEPRESGWAVVREGSARATSVHPTQAEAAKEGRDIARRDKTEFFLHAQNGQIREHNSYEEEPRPAKEEAASQTAGLLDAVTETVGEVSTGVSAAAGALGAAGGAMRGAGESPDREGRRTGRATQAAAKGSETTGEESDDTKEARDLAGRQHDDRSPEKQYAGYEIYDQGSERIGKLDDLFIDEDDNPEYVGVRIGSSDADAVLIPIDAVTVDIGLRRMVVPRSKSAVESGPFYGDQEDVTPEFEERVRRHYGLASERGAEDTGGYGAYYRDEERVETGRSVSGAASPTAEPTMAEPATAEPATAEPATAEPAEIDKVRGIDREGSLRFARDSEEEDELRVRRMEEELKIGTREREAGAVRVRKRVRTDHERIVVPRKRVEVTVERVPVEGQAISAEGETAEPEIREDEIVVPVIEEEIVVEKRPVIKEEIRIRKEVVEETEIVEEDIRREEVDVDDQTTRRDL